jgi:hypothetical protein
MILALAFLLTVLLEWPFVALCTRLGFARTGWFSLCMNGATWGAANGILQVSGVSVWIVELGIVVVETAILCWFWRCDLIKSFFVSLLMNLRL